MSEDRSFPRPIGGPVLLDGSGGVKVVARCSVDNVEVDLSDPKHHVCIPVEGGPARVTTADVAEAEYDASIPAKLEAAAAEAAARPAPLEDA